ncbi:NAD(P)-dependent dehydrogenase (short-subunit alcohol dehydrogenase family) [Bradyrhizobium sp. BR13661]|jgi:NAD(P)-dependent dehydrogenase (short-subunit alcohol dehydrogenase family)|nr:NAD(P)-dependent dehydrogenase (short-subunit alcohol dehydrogenase family) [Bradyrhizobium sp. BR13661]
MESLTGKNVVVIGGSRGVGRKIAEAAFSRGANVLAVARQMEALRRLAEEIAGIDILSLDATELDAPAKVFATMQPDVLVVCGGLLPIARPLQKQSWEEFSGNWEVDVKIAFNFFKASLSGPLAPGTTIVLVSSGAALAGSPLTGGYAGAKRTQLFMANYSQKESDRLGLGLRFVSVAPRIIVDTELGQRAVSAYASHLGVTEADFVRSMAAPPKSSDAANAVIDLVTKPDQFKEHVFIVSGRGLEAVLS